MELQHFDVKTAFLYGDLEESLYMRQPVGFEDQEKPNQVCMLKKSLYGLKQASRRWNKTFTNFLNAYNFKQLPSDQCVFFGNFNGGIMYLGLYVDDGLVLSTTTISDFLTTLKEHFKITVDCAEQFIGLNIIRDRERNAITINQVSYVKRMLEKLNMENAKSLQVPADPGVHLRASKEDNCKDGSSFPYREAIGSLIFLATVSRPNIALAVNHVSRYINKWSNEHVQAVKRIFRYMSGTVDYGIVYSSKSDLVLLGWLL